MPLAKLSSKGQVVLPKEVRENLGIGPGTTLRVTVQDGRIILDPLTTPVIDRLCGKFAGEDLLRALEAEHQEELLREAGS